MRISRGMTLVELISIVVISTTLMAVFGHKSLPHLTRDPETALRLRLAEVRNAILVYRHDTGLYPTDLSDLTTTEAPTMGLDTRGRPMAINPDYWRGPYLDCPLTCPVSGEPLDYYCDPKTGAMKVRSPSQKIGSDGRRYGDW